MVPPVVGVLLSMAKLDGERHRFYLCCFKIATEMAERFCHPSGESRNDTVVQDRGTYDQSRQRPLRNRTRTRTRWKGINDRWMSSSPTACCGWVPTRSRNCSTRPYATPPRWPLNPLLPNAIGSTMRWPRSPRASSATRRSCVKLSLRAPHRNHPNDAVQPREIIRVGGI